MAYRSVTLTPAYGRDYKSKAAVIADWNAGKDFSIQDFQLSGYVNDAQRDQLIKDGVTHLQFRYSKQTKITTLEL